MIGGQLDTIRLLISRGALRSKPRTRTAEARWEAHWFAVNGDPASIVEVLIEAGAQVKEGSIAWLEQQKNGSASVKKRVAEVLHRHGRGSEPHDSHCGNSTGTL